MNRYVPRVVLDEAYGEVIVYDSVGRAVRFNPDEGLEIAHAIQRALATFKKGPLPEDSVPPVKVETVFGEGGLPDGLLGQGPSEELLNTIRGK